MKINCWWKKALLGLGFVFGSVNAANADITVTFTNQTWNAFTFSQIQPAGIAGTLTGVSVNATLNASVLSTYADDLAIYVDPAPLSVGGGLLQVGGFSDLGATQKILWGNGGSATPGTTVIDTVDASSSPSMTPIVFTGTPSDPLVWLGNGYGFTGTSGTWTGSVTLIGVNAVPEPTSLMLTAMGMGLVGFGARRRRTV